jgi:hypothetical protein
MERLNTAPHHASTTVTGTVDIRGVAHVPQLSENCQRCCGRKGGKGMTKAPTHLKVAVSQESLANQLMDELREHCLDPKFDKMYIATLVGVIEMIKFEMMERHQKT